MSRENVGASTSHKPTSLHGHLPLLLQHGRIETFTQHAPPLPPVLLEKKKPIRVNKKKQKKKKIIKKKAKIYI
jgi:hypothetical protein